MGWADCGADREGRAIGYAFEATCDHADCTKGIDRGLAFACGGMHGDLEYACEKYFCEDHQFFIVVDCISGVSGVAICDECLQLWSTEHLPECSECRRANSIVGECEMCQLSEKRSWYRERRGNGVTYFECDVCPHIEVFPDEEY
jgi:hypothetical protein